MIPHIIEIFGSTIWIINPRPEFLLIWIVLRLLVVLVIKKMPAVIHPPIAKIKPTHEPNFLIDDNHFLMVRVKERNRLTRVPQDLYIRGMAFEGVLRVQWIILQSKGRLQVL